MTDPTALPRTEHPLPDSTRAEQPRAGRDGGPAPGDTRSPDDSDPPLTVDVRLLPAAVAAWAAALAVVRLPAGAAAACGALVTVLVVVGLACAARFRRGPALLPVLGLALAAGAVVLCAGSAQVAARAEGLLPGLARDEAAGRIEGVVVVEPTLVAPAWPGAPERARCVIAAERVTAGGRTSGAVGHVLVLGPASWTSVPYGARVVAAGRLRPGEPGSRTVAVLLAGGAPDVTRAAPPWDTTATAFRHGVRALAAPLPGDAGALLAGVSVGDTGAVPDDLAAAMRTAGLTHVTAVSGAHFSLVAALVLALAAAARLSRAARVALTVVAMAAMVLVVHPSPSVLRAAAMGLVGVLGVVLGRPHRAPAALSATVVLLLVADPWLAGELGFVLSVLATGGLVLVGGPLAERWSSRCGRPVATALALPVAAQLMCAPAILAVTPTVALYGVPANLLVAPALAPATVLGLAAGCVAPWWGGGAHVLALGAGAACWWIGAVARVVAAAPGAQVAWLPGWVGVVALVVASACVLRLVAVRGAAAERR
ncbi:ComEC/Rec2 family competence protein [Cellulomonas sp. ICMP 17802]|uniref:ComEC/Rec2 family competence protein n=1 Tax=Cellulomonas sp. ICMP 17802 TaxID=3239199 RepID=UPI00351AFFCD